MKYYLVGYWIPIEEGNVEIRVEELKVKKIAKRELGKVWWNGEEEGYDIEFTWVSAKNEDEARTKGVSLIDDYRSIRYNAMAEAIELIKKDN